MRKYWPYAPYTDPYLSTREDAATRASDREILLMILGIFFALGIIVITVMFYRHLRGWMVIQS